MLTRIVWSVVLIGLFGLTFQDARAQADEKKFEAGGQFSLLRLTSPTVTSGSGGTISGQDREMVPGFGGRFGYNISKHLALEAEGNFFPRNREIEGGRKIQGLFGVKAGKRFDRAGVFAKARPGFIHYEKGDFRQTGRCVILVFPLSVDCFNALATTNFALDLGGVVEIYPSKHTIIRFDAGDTIIRLGARNVAARDPSPALTGFGVVVIPVSAQTKHNFQGSVGFGFRF